MGTLVRKILFQTSLNGSPVVRSTKHLLRIKPILTKLFSILVIKIITINLLSGTPDIFKAPDFISKRFKVLKMGSQVQAPHLGLKW